APAGAVLGVDVSAPMLARARERAERAGLPNVRFEQADAQVHGFDAGAFDVVISELGVMFFDDPAAAFGNLRRALRPGGRLAFLCWQAQERNPYRMVPRRVIAAHVPIPDGPPPGSPGAFSLAEPEVVRELLGGAGFARVALEPVTESLLV